MLGLLYSPEANLALRGQLGRVRFLLFLPARAACAITSTHQIANVNVTLAGIHQIVASLARFPIWICLDGSRQRFLEGRCFDRFLVSAKPRNIHRVLFHFRFPAR